MPGIVAFILLLVSSSFRASGQDTLLCKYPVAIHFISEGAGVPGGQPISQFITGFRNKNHISYIRIDTFPSRGKEGEYTLGLCLSELSSRQKKQFIRDLKKVSKTPGDPGTIHYEENVTLVPAKNPGKPRLQEIRIN